MKPKFLGRRRSAANIQSAGVVSKSVRELPATSAVTHTVTQSEIPKLRGDDIKAIFSFVFNRKMVDALGLEPRTR